MIRRRVDRLTEVGKRYIDGEIDGGIIIVEQPHVFAKIAGQENYPDPEKGRRYDPAVHGRSIGAKF